MVYKFTGKHHSSLVCITQHKSLTKLIYSILVNSHIRRMLDAAVAEIQTERHMLVVFFFFRQNRLYVILARSCVSFKTLMQILYIYRL